MNDVVERVARAICCPGVCQKGDGPFSICQAHTWRQEARAAIEAMREPTEAMIAEAQARIDWIDAELEAEQRRLPYGDGSEPPCRNGYEISELVAERAGLIARNALSPKESE